MDSKLATSRMLADVQELLYFGSQPANPPVNAASVVYVPVTVANLVNPTRGYFRALVTDATTTTFGAAVVGGGANTVPVYSDGTTWRIG